MTHFFGELTPLVLCVGFVAGVLGNLAASALLGTPALWHLHRKLNRRHGEAADAAAAAHRIMADLFEHNTGRAHPDAPGNGSEAE